MHVVSVPVRLLPLLLPSGMPGGKYCLVLSGDGRLKKKRGENAL